MKKNKKNRGEIGATGIDLTTGALIFILFTSVVFTLYLQIYKLSALVKIHEEAMGYMILICEDIDMQNYQATENLDQYKTGVMQRISLPSNKYTLSLSKVKYTDTNSTAQDVVKRITISIKYNFDNEVREIKINKIKVKE